MSKTYAIIVAAGTGSRFGSDVPKQFLPLGAGGRPVLMHTIDAFRSTLLDGLEIRLIISPDMMDFWADLCRRHGFTSPVVIAGGDTRFRSVRNALDSLEFGEYDYVLIHDGVRPLVTADLIYRVRGQLQFDSGVIPVTEVTDSLRYSEDHTKESRAIDRSKFFAVQTPQGFRAKELVQAYDTEYRPSFTDDASVFESAFKIARMVKGDPDNIKITTPKDLMLAEILLKARK